MLEVQARYEQYLFHEDDCQLESAAAMKCPDDSKLLIPTSKGIAAAAIDCAQGLPRRELECLAVSLRATPRPGAAVRKAAMKIA